jgi:SAM-dependent methyltransferase
VSNEGYAGNFGEQWKKFRATQLDSYTRFSISRDRLRRCLGEELWSRLRGLQVLEVGCGAGRFTEVLLAEGAYVTSIDLSEAVDANAENFPVDDRHRIAQANLLALPFEPAQFDVVLCLGVLQHTPSPEASVVALARHVREGGALVIDHYTWDWGRVTSTRPLVRAILRRMSSRWTIAAVSRMVDFFLPWHRRLRSTTVPWSLLCRISPITTFYKLYPALPDTLQREWALLDTHDSLTDWYKHLRSRNEVARMISSAGLTATRCEYAGNGVEATGVRPRRST